MGELGDITSSAMPIPESAIDCGLSEALSVISTVPVRVPTAVGRKETLTAQFWLIGNTPTQLSVSKKSPVVEMLVIVSGPVPELVIIVGCALDTDPTA